MTFDPAAAGWKPRSQGPFSQQVGPVWSRREKDGTSGSVYALVVEECHTNSRGIVHGGMLMTLADHVLGWAVWDAADRAPCVTISLNNQFISAAKVGDFIEMRAQVVRKTRSLVFVQGTAVVGERIVLTAEGIWKMLGTG